MSHTCIVGLGDIGRRVAQLLRDAGDTVTALTRSPAAAASVETRRLDLDSDEPLGTVDADVIVYTIAPQASGEEDRRMQRFLAAQPRCRRLVYISTSGVYGDCGGDWVSETRPVHPQTDRARRRVSAETQLVAYSRAHGIALVILRVPGIYGPGRLPLERLRSKTPVLSREDSPWSNRIHADDLAGVCVLARQRGEGIYNVSDGQPTRMSEYFLTCARMLGLPAPAQVDWATAERELSPAMLSFLSESRRLDISRARQELGYTPRYPDLASGIRASLDRPQANARTTNQ